MSRSTIVKFSALVLAAILLVAGGAGSVSVHANPLQATDTAVATMAATTAPTIAAPAAATTAATMAATMAATSACPPLAASDSAMTATMAATMMAATMMAATMADTSAATAVGTTSAFAPGFLGVAVSTAPDGCGSIIEEVVVGQAAEKAGLKVNDEVIGADGKALTTSNALRDYVIAHNAGDTLSLSVLRGTGTPAMVIAVTLGTRPADALATVAATANTSSSSSAATPAATLAATSSN